MNLKVGFKNFQINGQTMSWTVSNILVGKKLANYLSKNMYFSNRLIKLAKSPDALLTINGKQRTVRYQVIEGDQIVIRFPEEVKETSLKATSLPLEIIYEDDHLIILNKQAGQVTVPSVKQRETSLANGVLYYYQVKKLPYTVHVVTRLDRDTSGLVLIAKHQYAHSLLANLQVKHKINRIYIGFVEGQLTENQAIINAPIARSAHSIIEREVNNEGQRAITHYKVLKEYANYSYIQMKLETGRTHQIRVHFSYIGHPLIGDDLYGEMSQYIKRQALHCKTLEFIHPFTQEKLHIEAPLPNDLLKMFDIHL